MILSTWLNYASIAAAISVTVAVLIRARQAIADWALAAGMLLLAAENLCSNLSVSASSGASIIRWQEYRLLALALQPGLWLLFSLTYARGNARTFLSKWRPWLILAFLLPVANALLFRAHLATGLTQTDDGQFSIVRLGWPGLASNFLLLIGAVLVLTNLERTYRASVGTMRWRIKFMLLGLALLFTVRIYTSSQALLFRGDNLSLQDVSSGALLLASLLMLRSLFRTGQVIPDIYPSQSVIEGSLTILLAGIYLLVVGVLAKGAAYLGGRSSFELSALVILASVVLLAVLLQSDRARLGLRRFVSRNFQRPLYDYRTMWRKFTEGTASRVEEADLSRSLVRLIADMFQSLSVSLWLVDEKRESLHLAASTSLPESISRHPFPQHAEAAGVIQHFEGNTDPVDIDLAKGAWAEALRRWQPGEFPNGGHRICIPLIGRGEVFGLITIGDRINGAIFTLQDFDMLKCVADHAAGSLLNVQLSQKLLQTKELEAFQTMAAFFVHDLKNAASTLNLMLQNLPVHYDDPAFREDALRGIGKTVTHINHLISRLSQLRHELKLQAAPKDLNQVVDQALASLGNLPGYVLTKDLPPLPKVLIDDQQLLKVITNLLLNATEAVPPGGAIKIATTRAGEWAILSVEDNGCGMSPEFLQRSLFRPFQTTKKSGLGIGMFQSKMIVEAHRGRIAVASKPGYGTNFQVFIPLPSSPP